MKAAGCLHDAGTCGCCEAPTKSTPLALENSPALPAIGYRVGTHSDFFESLRVGLTALPALSTRDSSDFTLALLDAFASMADVLTFYQERIANESYLRTATERLSLLELTRLIGYELRPGVAAETHLAFTLEEAPGSPLHTQVPRGQRVNSIPGPGEQPQTFETSEALEAFGTFNLLRPRTSARRPLRAGATDVYVTGTQTGLRRGDGLLFAVEGESTDSSHALFRTLISIEPDPEAGRTRLGWREPLEKPSVADIDQLNVYVFRQRVALFGHNAPDPDVLRPELRARGAVPSSTWPGFTIEDIADGQDDIVYLDALYPEIIPDSWVVLTAPGCHGIYRVTTVDQGARSRFTLNAKSTRLTLKGASLARFNELVRETVVYVQSEPLRFAEAPVAEPVVSTGFLLNRRIEELKAGRTVILQGIHVQDQRPRAEVRTIAEVFEQDGVTGIRLFGSAVSYERSTLQIFANAAQVTHGETRKEVLGSGDATLVFQQFRLTQPPLTFVSAPNAKGAASTLEVYVDDVRWEEVPTLYQRGPDERVYVTRLKDDGSVVIQFGDGRTGARLPTGVENVRAVFRRGIGFGGLVPAGQIKAASSPPLGLKSVINPLPATGAADPETPAEVRRNAPRTVLTLGRAVSLRDYEDFARSFAGVGKALATATWDGHRRGVFLTVAGPRGEIIRKDEPLAKNLLAALRQEGDPQVSLRIGSHRPVAIFVRMHVKVARDRISNQVKAAVEERLEKSFSFDAREFGQPVAMSELVTVVQNTPGVIALDVDELHRESTVPSLEARLPAALPFHEAVLDGESSIQGAELLLLQLRDGDIQVMR